MARQYHVLPTDLMNLSIFEFNLNAKIWRVGLEKDVEINMRQKAEMKAKQRTPRRSR